MKKAILTFHVYGISSDTMYSLIGILGPFRSISKEIMELLEKEQHVTEVEVLYIPSISMLKNITIEVQALTHQHEVFMKREDIQQIFFHHLQTEAKSRENFRFLIRKDLESAEKE